LDSDVDSEHKHFQIIEAFLKHTESQTLIPLPAYQKFENKQNHQMERNTRDAKATLKTACLLFTSEFLPMPEFCVSQVYRFLPLMSSYWERYQFEEALQPSAGDNLI
jgi:hypothetical protein